MPIPIVGTKPTGSSPGCSHLAMQPVIRPYISHPKTKNISTSCVLMTFDMYPFTKQKTPSSMPKLDGGRDFLGGIPKEMKPSAARKEKLSGKLSGCGWALHLFSCTMITIGVTSGISLIRHGVQFRAFIKHT